MEKKLESKFNGGLFGLIGVSILQVLLSVVTLGIGVPWAVCIKERWLARHTTIDGKQLVFKGKGVNLFGSYIKWFLLSIVTLSVYSWWIPIKMKAWVIKNTHFAETEEKNEVAPAQAIAQDSEVKTEQSASTPEKVEVAPAQTAAPQAAPVNVTVINNTAAPAEPAAKTQVSSKTYFCQYCGTKVSDADYFCGTCGAKLK